MTTHRVILSVLAVACVFAAVAAAAPAADFKIKVTAEVANIRVKPSISSSIVRQFPQGAIIEAVKKEGEWFLVRIEPDEMGAASGYVHESLVLPLEDIPLAGAPDPKPLLKTDPKTEALAPPKPLPVKDDPAVAVPPPAKPAATPPRKADPLPVSASGPKPARRPLEDRAYLALGAGLASSGFGDLNTGAQGLADLFRFQLAAAADTSLIPLNLGFLYGGELGIPVAPGIHLAVGVDRIGGKKESSVAYAGWTGTEDGFTSKPEFQAFPVKISAVYFPSEFFYLRAGASYVLARSRYFYRFVRDKSWQEWTGEATARGIGLHGGVGFDLSFGNGFGLFAEVEGRYAPLSGFKGTGTFLETGMDEPVAEEGTLYAFEAKVSNQDRFPLLYVRSKFPTEGGVENAREAEIDFSGVAFKAGLRIRF